MHDNLSSMMFVWLSSLRDVGLRLQGVWVCIPKGCGSPSSQDVDFSSHVPFLACMKMLCCVQMLCSMQDGTCTDFVASFAVAV